MIDISVELDKNTREYKAIRNAKEVTTVPQMVQYIASYGIEHLPDDLSNDPVVIEAFGHIQKAVELLDGKPAQLIALRPQVEKLLDLNREQRIMLQTFRDVFK